MAQLSAITAAASAHPILGIILIITTLAVGKGLYNVFLHPLRRYPGPFWWKFSRFPWLHCEIKGDLHKSIQEKHRIYGPTVRVAPDELSYIQAGAWKTIYGHRSVEMEKNLSGAGLLPPMRPGQARSIVTATREQHKRMRKTLSHAFSDKALKEQEWFLLSYVDQLVDRLREMSTAGPVDLVKWFNFTTFDVIGDMSFGEPFGCLQGGDYHEWVASIFQGVKAIPFVHLSFYLKLTKLAVMLTPRKLREAKKSSDQHAYDKVDRRIEKAEALTDRKDFLGYILKENDAKGMSEAELKETAVILIIAGSETTATFLSGTTYQLLRHPTIYKRLVDEVRTAFTQDSQITITAVSNLKYMSAVISESFRFYPPSPATFPRIVPGEGELIEGEWVPGGTTVGVNPWTANHSPENFYKPDEFLPERHLSDDMRTKDDLPSHLFERDNKDVVQPFSYGPRNCIGRNLAYAELRLITSKLLFHFDLRLAPQSDNPHWVSQQKTAMIWEKLPLHVELTERKP